MQGSENYLLVVWSAHDPLLFIPVYLGSKYATLYYFVLLKSRLFTVFSTNFYANASKSHRAEATIL